jgi:UDP-N-acetylmuramoyl-tripeptide--D-alanyl-D-alanine ligase
VDSLFLIADIPVAAGGRLLPATAVLRGTGAVTGISSVVVDSRQAKPGCLFVALRGERTDGHQYLAQAAEAGAACLLVSETEAARREEELARLAARAGSRAVAVADTLAALQDLARFHMRRLPPITRIGVTGSNGKTTTKELIGAILARAAATAVNEGNLNSEIGLPLACFAVAAGHRFAVFEMGMNRPGEMDILADIVRPDLALVTNVGTAHIGLLGSRGAIAREKAKIFSRFDGRQTGFLNEDEPFFAQLAEGAKGRIVRFGPHSTKGFEGSESLGLDGTLIRWEGSRIRFPLFGPYNLANALGAISVARELAIAPAAIREGLESVVPLFGRSQIVRGRVTVLVDCYNANPDSMASAIDFVDGLPWGGRKLAVLGAMRELGAEAEQAHGAVVRRAAGAGFDAVFLLGEEMEEAARQLAAERVRWFADAESLGRALAVGVRDGDLVLVKGSRGVELERVLPRITAAGAAADERKAACS